MEETSIIDYCVKIYCKFYRPCIWKDGPKGLIGNPGEMTSVIFHTLLPVSLWEFDETSEVFIRFGSDKLGKWNCDIGPMKKHRFVLPKLYFTVLFY